MVVVIVVGCCCWLLLVVVGCRLCCLLSIVVSCDGSLFQARVYRGFRRLGLAKGVYRHQVRA